MKDKLINMIKKFQKNEITEYFIYQHLAKFTKEPHNKKILNTIAQDELKHYKFWMKYTQIEITPQQWKIYFFVFLAKTL